MKTISEIIPTAISRPLQQSANDSTTLPIETRRKLSGSNRKALSSKPLCESCSGIGFVLSNDGKPTHCPACFDFFANSGLQADERSLSPDAIQDMPDSNGAHLVMRWQVSTMLANPFGWLAWYGNSGTAKSLALKVAVAGFCKRGVAARYYNANRVTEMLFSDLKEGQSNSAMLLNAPVLAIDELNEMPWTRRDGDTSWISDRMCDILTHRHDQCESLVTLLVFQNQPQQWNCPQKLISRMHDGRFAMRWPNGYELPNCLGNNPVVSGVMCVDGYDARTFLETERNVQIDPFTGEQIP